MVPAPPNLKPSSTTNRLTKAQGPYGIYQYHYDASHRRASTTKNGDTVQYQYQHGKDQLTGQYNANGQLLQAFSYDPDGHRSQGGEWTYQYDAAGRLAEVYRNEQWIASYRYYADGRRVSKRTSEGLLNFHYDLAGRLIEEIDGQANPVRQYLYSGDGDLLAVVVDDTPYFVHRDQRGAPQRLTGPTGSIAWQATYTPFGKAVVDHSHNIDMPLRLLGQYYDAETGLHYNQQRYYDPETGQYLRVDPLGLAGGFELYNYARQNPYRYVDPEGEFVFTTAAAVITGVSLALTAWDVYETVDGLASGEVTSSDLAGQYGRQKAIDIGLKAVPGVGGAAYLAKKGLERFRGTDVTKNAPGRGYNKEVYANRSVKPQDAAEKWDEFLGPGPHSNRHPRTGEIDPDRIVSSDGIRSIRYGSHEMSSKPTKHHYHEETWTHDPVNNVMNVENTVVRVPLPKK